MRGLACTQGTVRLLRQTLERVGLGGTLALGLEGISWLRGHPMGWGRPEVGQHDAQPEQEQDHQWIVDEVWYHGISPYMVEKGDHFTRFSSHRNYPQRWGTRPSIALPYH